MPSQNQNQGQPENQSQSQSPTPPLRSRLRSATLKRTHELTIRLTLAELDSVRSTAQACGSTMADLARRRLLDAGASLAIANTKKQTTKKRTYTAADPALVREIAKIGNNLNQIAHQLNSRSAGIDRVHLLAQLAVLEKTFLSLLPQARANERGLSSSRREGE